PSPLENVKPKNYAETFRVLHTQPRNRFPDSPCEAAAKASYDCLNRHDYVRDKCLDFFQAYRDCKKAWV
ncbi:hypothetical protein GLOTRDRAFT_26747, partial [Gloeophyllum trabeum ATCC 11539]